MVYEICHPLVMESHPGAASYVGYNCGSGNATVVMANCRDSAGNGLGTGL